MWLPASLPPTTTCTNHPNPTRRPTRLLLFGMRDAGCGQRFKMDARSVAGRVLVWVASCVLRLGCDVIVCLLRMWVDAMRCDAWVGGVPYTGTYEYSRVGTLLSC